jgi:hypothetical protein
MGYPYPKRGRRCNMHAIQAFLMKGLSISILAAVLIIPGSILAQEVTIYDKDWRVKERIRDGTIYDKDWRVKGHIEDGRIYDRDWKLKEWIEGDKIFDRNWNLKGRFKNDRIYDRN